MYGIYYLSETTSEFHRAPKTRDYDRLCNASRVCNLRNAITGQMVKHVVGRYLWVGPAPAPRDGTGPASMYRFEQVAA